MIAIAGGLAAAFLWGSSTVVASRSTRILGAPLVLAWVLLLGLLLLPAMLVVDGIPHASLTTWIWAVTAGLAATFGLLMLYRGLRIGRVGVVAPVASTEGAVAAVLSVVLLGEHVSFAEGLALVVIVAGVITVTFHGRRGDVDLTSALYGLAAACLFGIGLVASSQAGDGLGAGWTIAIARLIGVAVIVPPLVRGHTFALPGRALWMVCWSAFAEAAGYATYIVASRHSIAIAAVLGSQFAAVAAVGSYLAFGERLSRRQLAGAVVIISGVTLLAVFQSV